jgi:hypothetical protein
MPKPAGSRKCSMMPPRSLRRMTARKNKAHSRSRETV